MLFNAIVFGRLFPQLFVVLFTAERAGYLVVALIVDLFGEAPMLVAPMPDDELVRAVFGIGI